MLVHADETEAVSGKRKTSEECAAVVCSTVEVG